jgi:ABC-2 type transport system permease protein
LSDASILFGKMGAAIGYAGGLTVVCLLLGLLTVNLAFRGHGLVLYQWPVVLAMAVLGLLGATFVAGLGVLISLRAATVRQAQQTLSAAILVLLIAPIAVARMLTTSWAAHVHVTPARAATLVIIAVAVIAALDAAVVVLARLRFQRSRLVAD